MSQAPALLLAADPSWGGARIHCQQAYPPGHPLAPERSYWNQLVERGVDPPAFERKVADALAARFGDRPCRTELSAHVLTATA